MIKPVIAVVDDDPVMRLLLEALLTEAGYHVRCWANGLNAFEQLIRAPPALIVLDLRLGDDPEAGWQILSLLRMDQRTARTPVILLSADQEFLRHREMILRTRKNAIPILEAIRSRRAAGADRAISSSNPQRKPHRCEIVPEYYRQVIPQTRILRSQSSRGRLASFAAVESPTVHRCIRGDGTYDQETGLLWSATPILAAHRALYRRIAKGADHVL